MHTTYFGDLIYLYRKEITLALLLLLTGSVIAQNDRKDNLMDYDDLWIHYGFGLGLHNSKYEIQHSNLYASPTLDTVHSVVPGKLPGWKIAMIANMRLLKYLDFRTMLTVGFYEYDLLYRFTSGRVQRELKDHTMVEIPLLLKYKSARRGNIAMYMLGGLTPAIEVSGKGDEFDLSETLELKNFNVAIEAGVGFDLYFELFKFSPEIRYSWGLFNMLSDNVNDFSAPLQRLSYQNIAFYVTFEGGPTYLKKNSQRRTAKKGKNQGNRSKKKTKISIH